MIQNKCFENSLPNSKVWRLVLKNDIVSLFPNTPGTNHKDFHEERMPENRSGLQDLLVNT
jgi:hypothetical protein